MGCASDPSWQDWLIAALSGTLGSVIALGGLFGVYRLTQRSERQRASEIRRSESVVGVLEASAALSRPLAKPDQSASLQRVKEIDALANAFILFAAREMREHFRVARWAISVRDSLGKSATNLANETDPDAREVITDATSALAVDATASLILWLSDPKFDLFEEPEQVSATDV